MLVVLVRRVERERVPRVVLAGWPGVRTPSVVGLTVLAGVLYIVPGVVPTGAVILPGVVVLPGMFPVVVPGCPDTVPPVSTPGVPVVPRLPGTVVWAKAEPLKASPSRAAKNTWEVFINARELR